MLNSGRGGNVDFVKILAIGDGDKNKRLWAIRKHGITRKVKQRLSALHDIPLFVKHYKAFSMEIDTNMDQKLNSVWIRYTKIIYNGAGKSGQKLFGLPLYFQNQMLTPEFPQFSVDKSGGKGYNFFQNSIMFQVPLKSRKNRLRGE